MSAFRGDVDSSTSTPYHARCYLVSAAGAYKEAEYGVVTRELFTSYGVVLVGISKYGYSVSSLPPLPLFETSPFSPEGVEHVLLTATSTEYIRSTLTHTDPANGTPYAMQ